MACMALDQRLARNGGIDDFDSHRTRSALRPWADKRAVEFAIIMPYCPASHLTASIERIQMSGAPAFSWGVSSFPEEGVVASSLVAAADVAMCRRKSWLSHRSTIDSPHR